jgi:hypothetical protein
MENYPVLDFWRRQQTILTLYPTGDATIFAYAMTLSAGMHDQFTTIENYAARFEAYRSATADGGGGARPSW